MAIPDRVQSKLGKKITVYRINDGISKELASLAYVSVDDVVACALLAKKMDVKQAYRNIPVHPSDRACLCMSWYRVHFAWPHYFSRQWLMHCSGYDEKGH